MSKPGLSPHREPGLGDTRCIAVRDLHRTGEEEKLNVGIRIYLCFKWPFQVFVKESEKLGVLSLVGLFLFEFFSSLLLVPRWCQKLFDFFKGKQENLQEVNRETQMERTAILITLGMYNVISWYSTRKFLKIFKLFPLLRTDRRKLSKPSNYQSNSSKIWGRPDYLLCRTKDNAVLEFETRGNVRYLVTFCREK